MIEIIPNWHPILVHFTIALLTIAAILFAIAAFRGRGNVSRGLDTVASWNLWIGAAVTALTIAAGLQAAGSVAHDDAAHLAMENHKFWAFGTAGLFGILAMWNIQRVRAGQGVGPAFGIVAVIALVALGGTGLRGADLVFRHGLGVLSLPEVAGGDSGHSHEDGAEHAHGAAGDPSPAGQALSAADNEVIALLTAYHDALTAGDAAAPEQFVVADERFLMYEGKHVNRGWVDYRDHHLQEELADLSKVRFRLSAFEIQRDGSLAAVSFLFNVLPKSGPEMDFGSGRATAILLRTEAGWRLQRLHTS